jgi:hypothetical protein
MGKWKNNCIEMFLREDDPPRPGRAGTFLFGQQQFKDANHYFNIQTITGNHMLMNGFPQGFDRKIYTMPDGHQGGPYPKYNRKADEIMFFYGTDTNNLNDLGAHVEFHLGEGEDKKVFKFDEPRCIFIPKGVRHGPIYITQFRRNLIIYKIFTQPTHDACDIVNDWDYIGDDTKLREVMGDDIESYKAFYANDPKH